MPETINRQLVLTARPDTDVGPEHFEMRRSPVPALEADQALVRVHWLGIDATQRTWLNERETYTSPARIGSVMPGSGVGQIVASRSELFKVGDWVVGQTGWQDYALAVGEGLHGFTRIPEGIEPRAMLSVFGVNGLTAWFGMTEIAKPVAGETVFVSAAAGGVGSIAGQIARKLGVRTIGSAGGARKCAWLRDVAGFDACIDHRGEDMRERLGALAPDGIDVVFDNVGGATLEAALDHIAPHARIVLCGSISSGYRNDAYGYGPSNYMQLAFRRARMEGFIFLDFVAQFPQALYRMLEWIQAGDLRYEETISPASKPRRPRLPACSKGGTSANSSYRYTRSSPADHDGSGMTCRYAVRPAAPYRARGSGRNLATARRFTLWHFTMKGARMRILLSVAAISALSCAAAFADPPPPANATPLSEILQGIEASAEFAYFDGIEWDDGFYEVEFYTNDGTKKKIYIDPLSGEQRP